MSLRWYGIAMYCQQKLLYRGQLSNNS